MNSLIETEKGVVFERFLNRSIEKNDGSLDHSNVAPPLERPSNKNTDSTTLPPLIFFNGIPVSGSIYDKLIDVILKAEPRNIVVIDLPGTGKSIMKDPNYTWDDQRSSLKEYLARFDQYIPIIHDISGPIFLPLLLGIRNQKKQKNPINNIAHSQTTRPKDRQGVDRPSTVIPCYILLNTIIKPSKFKPIFPMSAMRIPLLGALVALSTPFMIFNFLIRREGFFHQNRVETHWLRSIFLEMSQNGGKLRLYKTLRAFKLTTETDRLIARGLNEKIPRLVIWGIKDRSLGNQLKYIPQSSQNEHQVEIPTGKHFLMMDHSEEIGSLILEFLRQG